MIVPKKTQPFGNEFHSICCCTCGVIFRVEMVEGKDRPKELGKPKNEVESGGVTAGLMVRMTEGIWYKGLCVAMDSGFCVLNGLVEMGKKGVYGASLIKKRRYWPKGVLGDAIDRDFAGKELGSVDAIQGIQDGIPYHIYVMKDVDYTIKIMSTHGTCELVGKETRREVVKLPR